MLSLPEDAVEGGLLFNSCALFLGTFQSCSFSSNTMVLESSEDQQVAKWQKEFGEGRTNSATSCHMFSFGVLLYFIWAANPPGLLSWR